MASEKTFDVVLRVTGQQSLAAVIACFEDKNLTCEVVSVKQAAAPEEPESKRMKYVNGRRNKGITGHDLVLEVLAKGPHLPMAIEREFVRRGFSRSSTSPAIARCVDEGLIERIYDGHYQLATPATAPAG